MQKSKYGAKKTVVDYIQFDSLAESRYYNDLKLLKRSKQIKDFHLQPEFILLEPFTDNTGKKQRAIKYKADFKIEHNDGTIEIIDVKSAATKTQQYMIRKKLFLYKFREYKFTELVVGK